MNDETSSINTVIAAFEGPGDPVPQPCPPNLIPYLEKVREQLRAAGLLKMPEADPPPPPSDPSKG
jgi:hypothetical protein